MTNKGGLAKLREDFNLTGLGNLSPGEVLAEHVREKLVFGCKAICIDKLGWFGEAGKEDVFDF